MGGAWGAEGGWRIAVFVHGVVLAVVAVATFAETAKLVEIVPRHGAWSRPQGNGLDWCVATEPRMNVPAARHFSQVGYLIIASGCNESMTNHEGTIVEEMPFCERAKHGRGSGLPYETHAEYNLKHFCERAKHGRRAERRPWRRPRHLLWRRHRGCPRRACPWPKAPQVPVGTALVASHRRPSRASVNTH